LGLDDPPAHREADADSVRARVEPREHPEDAPRVLRRHAEPVVPHAHDPLPRVGERRHLDAHRLAATESKRVRDEILENTPQLPRVGLDLG
jgi:hypothetical protein